MNTCEFDMINIRISNRLFLLASVFVCACYPASTHADVLEELKCWNGHSHSLATREGMVCAIQWNLKSMWQLQLRILLEMGTDLRPDDIDNYIIPKVLLPWAECKYAAYVNFSEKRPDIPLDLIFAQELNEPITEEELVRREQFSGFEPLNAKLEKCKHESAEAIRKYLPDPLDTE